MKLSARNFAGLFFLLLIAGMSSPSFAVENKDPITSISSRLEEIDKKISAIQTDLATIIETQNKILEETEKTKVRAFRA